MLVGKVSHCLACDKIMSRSGTWLHFGLETPKWGKPPISQHKSFFAGGRLACLVWKAELAWCGRLSLLSNCLPSICCLRTASQCSSVVEPSWPLLMGDDSSVLVDSAIGTAASSTLAGDDSSAIASLRGIGRCGLPACSAVAFFFTSKIGLGSSCWCRLMYRLYGCLLLALLSAQVAAVALTLLSQSFHAATEVAGRRSRMTRGDYR